MAGPFTRTAVRSIERGLRPPAQAGEIWVFTRLGGTVRLVGLSFCPACFFVSLLLLPGFLPVSLRGGGFTWSSDDALLSNTMS